MKRKKALHLIHPTEVLNTSCSANRKIGASCCGARLRSFAAPAPPGGWFARGSKFQARVQNKCNECRMTAELWALNACDESDVVSTLHVSNREMEQPYHCWGPRRI